MKKIKFSFGEGGIKQWLTLHVEKIVLVVAFLLVVLFIYSGASLEGFDKTPAALRDLAVRAADNIQRDSSREIVAEIPPESFTAVSHDLIPFSDVLRGPTIVPKKADVSALRRDPLLLPPLQLEVTGVLAPMVIQSETERVDPFANDGYAVVKRKKEEPRRRPRRNNDDEERVEEPAPRETESRKELSQSFINSLPGIQVQGASNNIAETRAMVAINAVIEYKKQVEEYRNSLPGTLPGGQPEEPNYVFFYLERAEVVEGQPLTWQRVGSTKGARRDEVSYGLDVPEVAREDQLIPETITMKIPPVLLVDPEKIGTHSLIPKKGELEKELPGEQGQPEIDPSAPDVPFDAPSAGQRRTDPHGESSRTPNQAPKAGAVAITDYKLLRVYDFDVQPGKQYRYRVQLLLEDPNRPREPFTKPPARPFDPAVVARLREVQENEKTTGRRIWYRETEWSQPSEIVEVPVLDAMIAGGVHLGRTTRINKMEVELEPTTGKLLLVKWDWSRAVPASGLFDIQRGSSLYANLDVEVMHPVTKTLRLISEFPFQNDGVVLDMRGGETLPGSSKDDPLLSPGEFVVLDHDGKLRVQNELDDMDAYRRYLFEDAMETLRRGEERPRDRGPHGTGPHGRENKGADSAAEDLLDL